MLVSETPDYPEMSISGLAATRPDGVFLQRLNRLLLPAVSTPPPKHTHPSIIFPSTSIFAADTHTCTHIHLRKLKIISEKERASVGVRMNTSLAPEQQDRLHIQYCTPSPLESPYIRHLPQPAPTSCWSEEKNEARCRLSHTPLSKNSECFGKKRTAL